MEERIVSYQFTNGIITTQPNNIVDPFKFYQAIYPESMMTNKAYYITFAIDFLATQGGLIVSVLGLCNLFMSSYGELAWQTSMVTRLYHYSS